MFRYSSPKGFCHFFDAIINPLKTKSENGKRREKSMCVSNTLTLRKQFYFFSAKICC